eukprot:COSAG01_NODE_883_length_12927_cov_10.710789_8_plen_92_part_00
MRISHAIEKRGFTHLRPAGMVQPCYSNDDWSWDELYLNEDGTLIAQEILEFYSFDISATHISSVLQAQAGVLMPSYAMRSLIGHWPTTTEN